MYTARLYSYNKYEFFDKLIHINILHNIYLKLSTMKLSIWKIILSLWAASSIWCSTVPKSNTNIICEVNREWISKLLGLVYADILSRAHQPPAACQFLITPNGTIWWCVLTWGRSLSIEESEIKISFPNVRYLNTWFDINWTINYTYACNNPLHPKEMPPQNQNPTKPNGDTPDTKPPWGWDV